MTLELAKSNVIERTRAIPPLRKPVLRHRMQEQRFIDRFNMILYLAESMVAYELRGKHW